jgi:integrase-like protein
MREHQLRALDAYRMRRWSVGKPSVLIPNLLKRQFTVTRRNKVWVTDITYIRTWQGWLYLAVVMDLFSRKIVGWSTASTIHPELVLDAVLTAVRRRRRRGTMIHSVKARSSVATPGGLDPVWAAPRKQRRVASARRTTRRGSLRRHNVATIVLVRRTRRKCGEIATDRFP